MAPANGYWGKQTATIDWCEENYAVSYYIAEFWNTLSNAAIMFSPLLMLTVGYKQQHEKRFVYSFLAVAVVGIGSWFFHMTLQYSMQLMDEVPMLWASACFIYVALMTKSKHNEDNSLLQIALFITCLIITVVYILVEVPVFLQVTYGLLNVAAIVIHIKIMMTTKCVKKYFLLGLACYLAGFFLWNVDNIYCHHLRSIRVHNMANLSGILFQCHAWWHILSGFGAYLGLLFAVKSCMSDENILLSNISVMSYQDLRFASVNLFCVSISLDKIVTMKKRKETKKPVLRREPVNLLRMHGNTKWHEACNEVYQLVKSEQDINAKGEPVDAKPIASRRTAFEGLVMKYIRYVKSYNMLCDCYKWLIHPQKRSLLRRCIEAVAGRLCEIKYEMINLDKCLFNYVDDILIEMSLTPADLKLLVPKYMLAGRLRVLHMREQILSLMLERIKSMDNPQLDDVICHLQESRSETSQHSKKTDSSKPSEPLLDATSQESCEVRSHGLDVKPAGTVSYVLQHIIDNISTNTTLRNKILLLQSTWRCWLCRRRLNKLKESEEIAIGMKWPRVQTYSDDRDKADYSKREEMYREREQELKISKAIEHERFMAAHGHNIAWELKYNITQWLLELRDLQGTFPDYPDEDEGGCEKLFAMKTMEQVEEEISEFLNPTPGPPQKEERKDQGRKAVVTDTVGWKPAPTATVPKLIDALEEYNSYWYLKDEMDNIEQKFDRQLMLEKVRDEAGKQIRLQVDDLMRYELDKLRCGIEFIEMDARPRNKNAKADEKDKEPVTKDPLASKTVEELYGELVLQGIVTPVQNVKLDDIISQHNFGSNVQEESMPTIEDIKTTLTHLVLFPLSSPFLHTVLPLTNRMLFAGSPGVGKTMMIHALCRETGANLFDISPDILAGKYEGQEQQEYLMNALLKVGKSLEPTIFTIDDCDVLFTKSPAGPPPGQDRPQRWVSVFSKMMDKMKKGDRMFLIGETTEPFACNSLAMAGMFKNVIYFPRPEYGSRLLAWKTLLARKLVHKSSYALSPSALAENVIYFPRPEYGSRLLAWKTLLARKLVHKSSYALSPSALAEFSEGYSVQEIEHAINETLTNTRLASRRRLTNMEFLMTLTLDTNSDPLYVEDVDKWTAWYWSTPLMKKRRQLLDEERYARQLQEAM